jgi:hypothetical protein
MELKHLRLDQILGEPEMTPEPASNQDAPGMDRTALPATYKTRKKHKARAKRALTDVIQAGAARGDAAMY